MASATIDRATRGIVLLAQTEGQPTQESRLHPGVVGSLTIALMGLGAQVAPNKGASGITGQVMHLNGVRPAVVPSGQLILDLVLENGFHLPVTFPPKAIRGLQTALAERQKVSTAAQAQPPRHKH